MQDSRFTSVLWSLVSILESERSFKNIKLDLVAPTLKSSKDFLVLQIKIQGLDKNPKWPGCLIILLFIFLPPFCALCYEQDSEKNPTEVFLAAGSCRFGAFSCIWYHCRLPLIIPCGQTFFLPCLLTLLSGLISSVMFITCLWTLYHNNLS